MTLFEAVLALSILSILTLAGTTSARRFADRAAVESAQGDVLNAYRRAQSAARAWGRPAEIVVSADSIVVRTVGVGDSVVVWRKAGPAGSGVSLTPAVHVTAFSANGLLSGAGNVTYALEKGSTKRTVVLSRLGRVRVR